MPRKPKPEAMKMESDLRIPVTADQKKMILDAVSDEPTGFAAWARTILFEAAKKKQDAKAKK